MTQNIIALIIVFLAAAISLYSIIKSLVFKKTSKCDGCSGCDFKKSIIAKPCNPDRKKEYDFLKMVPAKIEKI